MSRAYETLFLVLLLLVIWLAISSASVLVILSNASPEACAFWRLSLSIPIISILGNIVYKQRPSITRLGLHNVIAGVALSLHFILWMNSLFLIPIFISTLLVTMYPLYSLILEVVLFKRGIKIYQVLGIIASTALLALYLEVNELVLNLGAVKALIAGFLAGVYFVVGHYARRYLKESIVDYSIRTYLAASITTLFYALVFNKEIIYFDVVPYLYFIAMAIVPMILGHTLMNYLLERYPSSLITMVSYGEPFGAGLLGYMILGQKLSITHLIYGLIIVTCVFLTITTSMSQGTLDEEAEKSSKS